MAEELLILGNPRRKRRKNTRNAKGQFVKRRRRRNPIAAVAANPRRKRRRNPVGALAVAANPRRRRRHARRVHARRRRRSNPRLLAGFSPRSILNAVIPAAVGGAGAVALDVALSYVPMPAFLQSGPGKMVGRVGGAIALGMLARFVVGRETANKITLGALTVAAYGTIRDFAVQAGVPGLSAYDYSDTSMGYTSPAPMLNAYMPGAAPPSLDTVNAKMGAYMSDGI